MKKLDQFTFKTTRPTGRYRSFWPDHHDIKFGGKVVGSIVDREWKIKLMIMKEDINEDPADTNCEWKWIKLKHESSSLQEAKDWLNRPEVMQELLTRYILHQAD